MSANTKTVERQGLQTVPYTTRYPQVRGGICEHCGVIDPNTESKDQYKLCNHYRGLQLRCSYCPENADQEEMIYKSNLNVADSPTEPGKLVVWCNSYECSRAHEARFKRSR